MAYSPPTQDSNAFNCPHCGAFAQQHWSISHWRLDRPAPEKQIRSSSCTHCGQTAVWVLGTMVYPDPTNAPLPTPHLPADLISLSPYTPSISSTPPRPTP